MLSRDVETQGSGAIFKRPIISTHKQTTHCKTRCKKANVDKKKLVSLDLAWETIGGQSGMMRAREVVLDKRQQSIEGKENP